MTTSERVDRLERAVAQLMAGVDWSRQRGGISDSELQEVCAESRERDVVEINARRRATLERELAGLGDAA